MKDKKITIIIPVYNTPKELLYRCFDSIYNQTCKNFDLIIINDGSGSETRDDICEYFNSHNFNKISVINKNNTGVSEARNVGLDIVKTEYVAFADSDDEYCLDFIEKSYEYIKNIDFDFLIANIDYIPKWKSQKKAVKNLYISEKCGIIEVKKSLLELIPREYTFNVNVGPYAKLYKTNIAKKIKFDTGVIFGEDIIFNRYYIDQCAKIFIVRDIVYKYYQNEFSATRRALKYVGFDKYSMFWDRIYEIDKKELCELGESIYTYEIKLLNGYVNRSIASNPNLKFFEGLSRTKEAVLHKMIKNALGNIKVFTNKIGFLDSINVLLLRMRLCNLYLLEKILIYKLGLNKDKI